MKIIKVANNNHQSIINQAVKTLKADGLVIYPTETCYGAGVDATNQKAVNKLLAYKTFRQGKPISIAVTNQTMASKYITPNTSAINLYTNFLPGPLTVISKSLGKTAKYIESDTKTIGIRIPNYKLTTDIIKKLNKPITATSANASYKKHPYSIKDILNNTSKKQQSLIDLIIDAGTLPKRPPSTIVDTTLNDPLVLRTGSVLEAQLRIDSPEWNKVTLRSGNSKILTTSPQQTINLAKTLMLKHWNHLQKKPLIFLLIGKLGAGKTQFTKGIGEFLKIKQHITSPTYTIQKEYQYNRHSIHGLFLHLDTWRMQNIEEFNQLNLKQHLKPKNVIAIEWADRALQPLLNLAKKTNAKLITINLKIPRSNPEISSELPSSFRQITF
ncbi:MAG: L-threonylcarbamoyladenylate synthase [Patescibacteria group bacterium]|nr:L-threonylcarbamoyladenylate synthase [Patescibacteria group bacterium]